MTQVFNYLFGSMTRIYTTLQEVDDRLILYGFVGGFVLNVVLAAQMVGSHRSGPGAKTMRVKKPILITHRYIIGIVQHQHCMQERLARNQRTLLWAPVPEPRPKGRDQQPAAEDS